MGSMAASRAAPRAGASPAPTIYGWALRSCIVGLTLAVNLGAPKWDQWPRLAPLPERGQAPPLLYTVGHSVRV